MNPQPHAHAAPRSPLFVTVTFGLPASDMLRAIDLGELVQRSW